MIINGYTNSFRENVESDMSFHALHCPQLFIRQFPERVPYNKTLVIPYAIIDPEDHRAYSDESTKTYTEDTLTTYTTFIKLDAHTGSNPRTWKRTSIDGEHRLEIGPFTREDVGVHIFSINCVDSFGVGSTVHDFKFMVEDPDDEPFVVDLDSNDQFSGSFCYSSTALNPATASQLPVAYLDSTQSNTLTNPSSKIDGLTDHVVKRTIVAGYNVSVVRSNSIVQKIVIDVSAPSLNTETPPINPTKGCIYKYDVQKWGQYQNAEGTTPGAKADLVEDITGTYTITLVHNGTPLSEYISCPPGGAGVVPDEIRRLAAYNKLALNRLMEAAQACAGWNRCILKLPTNLSIVTDYHLIKDNGELGYTINDGKKLGGTLIQFPDNFILDMNGCAISILQNGDLHGGILVALSNNFNTIVRNGRFFGTYKYFDKTLVSGSTEWCGVTAIYGSDFSYFDNCEFAYSLGYDAGIESYDSYSNRNSRTKFATYSMPYNSEGYIDYNGVWKGEESVLHPFADNVDDLLSSPYIRMRTTDGGEYRGFVPYYLATNYTPPKYMVRLGDPSCLDIASVATDNGTVISGTQTLRRSFHSVGDLLWGNFMDLVKADGSTTGFYTKLGNRECFVHFYDNNRQFIKTIKARDMGPVLIPNDAKYIGYSSYGVTVKGTPNSLYIQKNDYNGYHGQCFALGSKRSWCSGYRNCVFHDNRTSLFDNKYTNQCFAEDCYMYNMAGERVADEGGFSNQTQFVDIEDVGVNDNFFVTNCENIYGRAGFKVHSSYNLCLKDVRNVNMMLQKNVYGAQIDGTYGEILVSFGFSVPIRYHSVTNNIFNRFRLMWEFSSEITDGDSRVYASNSTLLDAWYEHGENPAGSFPKLYTNRCHIFNNHFSQ